MIRVFTTRPDTLFGATYMVLAPEHPLVDRPGDPRSARSRRLLSPGRSRPRATWSGPSSSKVKTGVFTGRLGRSIPSTARAIPVWIADYVADAGYGTGAIMAVPGHDERDFAFAKAFDLPILRVVAPSVEPGRRAARRGRGRITASR